ncbi:hypothetical protein BDV18DRAFT_163717 [Aspergillus unguis]
MAEFQIPDSSLTQLKDKVVLITGSSSGIGKATVQLALSLGAKVIAGDINALPDDFLQGHDEHREHFLFFARTDVTDWSSLRNLFVKGIERFGRIDHVFANAGIGPKSNFLEETFEEEESRLLAPPNLKVIDVNLFRDNNDDDQGQGDASVSPSITITASASSFQDFGAADYTVAKHGVLGILRGLYSDLQQSNAESLEPERRRRIVRLNAISPSWTRTGLVNADLVEKWGVQVQGPEAVAKSVVMLFNDAKRHGELIYSWEGRYCEINRSEGGLLEGVARISPAIKDEGAVMERMKGR